MNKRLIVTTVFALLVTSISFGQRRADKGEMSEKLKAKKIAYIIESLDMTAEESEQFWPIYNEYKDEMKALHSDARVNTDMSEEEAKAYLSARLDRDRTEIKLKEEYNERFLSVISAKKLVKLSYAERKFKHEMLNDIKRRYSSRRSKE